MLYVRLKPGRAKIISGVRILNPGPHDVKLVVEPADHLQIEEDKEPNYVDREADD